MHICTLYDDQAIKLLVALLHLQFNVMRASVSYIGKATKGPFNLNGQVIASIIRQWMKLLIHSQTSTIERLMFENVYIISPRTLLGMWLLIHAGIQVNPC